MLIIDNQKILNEFCRQLLDCKTISVDTEFLRKNTYFAQLSIIQIMTSSHKVIIDTLCDLDLSPLNEIFLNEKILKIFHAPREDFEIFYHLFKKLPRNVFDIQIAAGICDFGKHLSYSDICSKICFVHIDKTYQRSDWLKRPISANLLDYAIKDVEYLEPIYKILQSIIQDNNLQNEYDEQIKSLLNIKNYIVDTKKAWQKVRFHNHSEFFINKMKIMAAYREEQASTIDLPRRHFISDEELVKICQHLPTSNKDFENLKLNGRYLSKQKYRTQLADLCLAIQELGE
ncbi:MULTISPECIES: ribonuclease D [Rickettsieae]|uniref:ribonuclease D n=1 Tax=Rickettsieae TaxID=33988 RepID=UPI000B9B8414|nr:ribonuclease D [Rickettsia endosymbiont of Culicoides newsteadi]OZG32095.1 ribonuclease D [Rickettsia endosymbiont of Culicoides newsteadi]